ncbi:DMT family transporter [Variovorax sp. RB2P76]|uniref:DMT family transporter n=1 Tax=Variovorax sp. RB2P76 TaxID=3443736 RepID=UPI003F46924E
MTSAQNRRGIALMISAMACYALNDAFVKLTLHAFPTGQVLTVRGAAAVAVLAAVSWRRIDMPRSGCDLCQPMLALRCALEITTAVTSVLALARVSLAVVSSLMMTAPLLIVVVSMTLRWEPARLHRLLGASVGLAGALLVLRPSEPAASEGVGFACLCAASLAARDMINRRLPASLSSARVAILTTFAVCAAGLVLGVASDGSWSSLARRETLAIAGAAICSALGNYALIAACRKSDLSAITPFRYTLVVWSCLLGYLVWDDVPDLPRLAGIVLITVAGLMTLRCARQS